MEISDARWFTRGEVLSVLERTSRPDATGEPLFKIPPPTAIAGVLIKQWAEGNVTLGYAVKGNL